LIPAEFGVGVAQASRIKSFLLFFQKAALSCISDSLLKARP
jgi:hypothetical protein